MEERNGEKAQGFLLKGPRGQQVLGKLKDAATFFEGVPEDQVNN